MATNKRHELGWARAVEKLSGNGLQFGARFAGFGAVAASLGEAELLCTDL